MPLTELQTSPLAHWLTPDWPVPSCVRAVCTTRTGGVSKSPFDSMNVGLHVGDAPADAQHNRALLAQTIGVKPVFLNQVHGWQVSQLDALSAPIEEVATADASITCSTGLACTIMVADCLPVLFCSADGGMVGAAHAGWRGLLGFNGHGVLEAIVQEARAVRASSAPCLVWLGPCIGPSAFEVGEEVRQAFVSQSSAAQSAFFPMGEKKWLADLALLARQRLQALGVDAMYGNDSSSDWCTVKNASRFFSHRRDRVSGRFAAAIWRTD